MEISKVADYLYEKIPSENILIDEPMKNHTSFKIGGPADFFVRPANEKELTAALECCRKYRIPYYIIGNGSNLLVDDRGYRGMMIQLYKNLDKVKVDGITITASSGALLSRIASLALEYELTGFEFAQGIPGTLGGAVTMNAGAYEGEMKDVILSVKVMNTNGEFIILTKEELALGYRTSIVQTNEYIVLEAVLELKKGEKEAIASKMKDLAARRREKQPLEMPSAGSTFKRPTGHFAGKLIMDAGLRGYKIGGAMVSEKHCGFVVSDGTATFEDVKELIEYIRKTVKKQFNVELQPEIKIISDTI